MDKFVPDAPDILDRLYTETQNNQTIGSLNDLLQLELNDNYKSNMHRSPSVYKFTEEQINIVQKKTK